MFRALAEAQNAFELGEVPVGAVAVRNGEIIARAWNQVEMLKDATAHAEVLLISSLSSIIGDWRLEDVDIYVTKEPCAMCAGAMVNSRVRRVIFGMADPRSGCAGSALDVYDLLSVSICRTLDWQDPSWPNLFRWLLKSLHCCFLQRLPNHEEYR